MAVTGVGGFQNSTGFSGGDSTDVIESDRPHDPAASGIFSTDFRRWVVGGSTGRL